MTKPTSPPSARFGWRLLTTLAAAVLAVVLMPAAPTYAGSTIVTDPEGDGFGVDVVGVKFTLGKKRFTAVITRVVDGEDGGASVSLDPGKRRHGGFFDVYGGLVTEQGPHPALVAYIPPGEEGFDEVHRCKGARATTVDATVTLSVPLRCFREEPIPARGWVTARSSDHDGATDWAPDLDEDGEPVWVRITRR